MNLSEAKELYAGSSLDAVDIVPNTSIPGEWVLLVRDKEGKSFFLVDKDDRIKSFESVDSAITVLQLIGFKRAKLFF